MTPEVFVRERIVSLNTSAATRVFQLKLRQGLTTWPAVRVQGLPTPRGQHLRGPDYPAKTRVQVEGYAPESSGGDPYATVTTLMEEIRGDGLGPSASGLFGWIGVSDGSPAALRILNIELHAGQPFYEPGAGVGDNGAELRLVGIRDEYIVHWTPMN